VTPPSGASYAEGEVVDASFSCQPGASGGVLVSGAAGCAGTVADGQPIDTSTAGQQTFTVTATDTDGQTGTASSTYVVTGPPGGTGGGGACKPAVGQVKTSGTAGLVPIRATGSVGSSCTMKLTLTVTESVKGGKVIAVAAAKHGKKTTKKVVVVGSATVKVAVGKSQSVRISLNGTGKRLLTKHHTLKAKLVITDPSVGKTLVIFSKTITFKTKPQKKHKH
jgi:hypothetical protein